MTTSVLLTNWGGQVLSANGGGLVTAISGSGMSIDTTVYKDADSPQSLKCTVSSASSYASYNSASGNGIVVGRVYVYFPTALPTTDMYIIVFTAGDSTFADIMFQQSSAKFAALQTGGTPVLSSVITYNTWYRIDWRFTWNSTTHKIEWYVNGVQQTNYTIASQTSTTLTNLRLGSGSSASGTVNFCHLNLSVTTADYPIGAGIISRVSPASDGTHVSAANVMEFQDGTDIRPGTTTAYTAVNSIPIGNTTNYIIQSATSTSSYVEVYFAKALLASIRGASAYLAYRAATTSADEGACTITNEDGTVTTLWGNFTTRADYSESSVYYKSVILPAPAGGWDANAINTLYARMGGSNDVNPVPYWVDLLIEYEYYGTPRRRNMPFWI